MLLGVLELYVAWNFSTDTWVTTSYLVRPALC